MAHDDRPDSRAVQPTAMVLNKAAFHQRRKVGKAV
jgi:hypothetical protein